MAAKRLFVLTLVAVVACSSLVVSANAAGPDAKQYAAAVEKAVDYLSQKQAEDGSWCKDKGPALTAVVTTGLLSAGRSSSDPVVAKGLKYLEGFVQPDGSICTKDSTHKNYETAMAMLAFSEANKDGKYKQILTGGDKYLKGEQWGPTNKIDKADVRWGGAGYGGADKTRPDLSNTSFMLDALKAAGNGPQDEAIQRALVFVSRSQNLDGPNNTTGLAKVNDGGFYYTPAANGVSQAGQTKDGKLRSYGSMTYAGLKSMIYAGLGPDDPRVMAAVGWLKKHYTLTENPGMGEDNPANGSAGLYYYYQAFAKAMDAYGKDTLVDDAGHSHDWRAELTDALAKAQKPDGSWSNSNKRFMEDDSNLSTSYGLIALRHCKPK